MQNNMNRAVQFLPFDALKGFKEALLAKEKELENKKNLSEDASEVLNTKLQKLTPKMNIRIKYYCNLEYIETHSIIKKIDKTYRKIYLSNTIINFDDILDIEII